MTDLRLPWLALVSSCLAACAANNQARDRLADQCDVTSIDAVFESPMTFHGQRFCGYGFYYEGSEIGGVYSVPITNERDRYDVAFLFDAASRMGPRIHSPQNARVFVEGTIDAATCNLDRQPEGEGCTPVMRAIFLENWTLRPE